MKNDGIKMSHTDSEDFSKLMEALTPEVEQKFSEDSPQHLLWQEQLKYNRLNKKQQTRWHPLVIRFALSLLYSSRAAYHTVTSSGFLSLPSKRTLRDYSHWCTVRNGVYYDFITQAKTIVKQEGIQMDDAEQPFVVLIDEMKIRSGLIFNKNTGELVGFTSLGQVNHDIDTIASSSNGEDTVSVAKKVLAFMIRPVFRPSLAFTVAAYPTRDISGSQLFPIVWEVVEALELSGFPVYALVADGASSNRQFYKLCCKHVKNGVPYKTKNPFARRNIYFFCDAPHLIKTTRNCFSNSYAHRQSRELQVSILLHKLY